MSAYAFDPDRREVVATWSSSVGALARVVVAVGAEVSDDAAILLCAQLSRLSEALWDTYVRPATAAEDDDERERRDHERDQLEGAVAIVRTPNLPDASGLLLVSYSPVEESAHRLGGILRHLADPKLTDTVAEEIGTEVDAVIRAELGDLSGRAVQASALDRVDASPIQVGAADGLLRADPLGEGLLSAPIDPAAACVAAAHWLGAAAVVAAEAAGTTPAGVFAEADDIQAVSVLVPTFVVESIEDGGRAPRQVVLELLRVAVAAADGVIADLPGVLAERARWKELVKRLPSDQLDATRAAEPARTTLLDPRRPARDLLEHLLDGIASCRLLYAEYADDLDDETDDLDLDGDIEADGRRANLAAEFAEIVRGQAAATHARLT